MPIHFNDLDVVSDSLG